MAAEAATPRVSLDPYYPAPHPLFFDSPSPDPAPYSLLRPSLGQTPALGKPRRSPDEGQLTILTHPACQDRPTEIESCFCWSQSGGSPHDGDSETVPGRRMSLEGMPVYGPPAGVAEWQTRWIQNPVWATRCGFKSHLRYLDARRCIRMRIDAVRSYSIGLCGVFFLPVRLARFGAILRCFRLAAATRSRC